MYKTLYFNTIYKPVTVKMKFIKKEIMTNYNSYWLKILIIIDIKGWQKIYHNIKNVTS